MPFSIDRILPIHRIARGLLSLAMLFSFTSMAMGQAAPIPKVTDARLSMELFADLGQIATPIGLEVDRKGRVFVIESHTHFRPGKYKGPAADRIRMFEDTDGDGKADRISTFYEGTVFTMDLLFGHDGWLYVATRMEIFRLKDMDGDGKAETRQNIASLKTKGNYPHNGLSGLAMDFAGRLHFGLGENLGEPYELIGADGGKLTGGGEGGNVYRCTADGKSIEKLATGFWNPFGMTFDIYGNLFCADNDPDAVPYCRLLHVVPGADFGYQFRYGRTGLHPLTAWNGDLSGTLGMISPTGEAPCELLAYESDGLPEEYRGNLLLASWADHKIERYVLKRRGASFGAERTALVTGGENFRPVGMAVAPDGSIYISDWVDKSYELHGKGRLWRLRAPGIKPGARDGDALPRIQSPDRWTREGAARELAARADESGAKTLAGLATGKAELRIKAMALQAMAMSQAGRSTPGMEKLLGDAARQNGDPLLGAMAVRLLREAGKSTQEWLAPTTDAAVRAQALRGATMDRELLDVFKESDPFLRQALRFGWAAALKGNPPHLDRASQMPPDVMIEMWLLARQTGHVPQSKDFQWMLHYPDPRLRMVAARWIADDKLEAHRGLIEEAIGDPTTTESLLGAYLAVLERLDGRMSKGHSWDKYLASKAIDESAPVALRTAAVKLLPADHPLMGKDEWASLLKPEVAPAITMQAVRTIAQHPRAAFAEQLAAVALDVKRPAALRADAVAGLAAAAAGDSMKARLLELAMDEEPVVRAEALRALTGNSLDATALDRLREKNGDLPGAAQMLQRLAGRPTSEGRPALTETDEWIKRYATGGDEQAGRRVFFNARVSVCWRCHRVEGRGSSVGPDLTRIGETSGVGRSARLMQSILEPSREVAPQFAAWQLTVAGGNGVVGYLLEKEGDREVYVDGAGNRLTVDGAKVTQRTELKVSMMPAGLLEMLTDQEIKDLLAYLLQKR